MAIPWNQSGDAEQLDPERNAASDSATEKASNWWEDSDPPREDSEMHVLELLQRLEGENNPVPRQNNSEKPDHPTKWAQWEPEIVCSSCHYLNSADQKFCGYCGTSLLLEKKPAGERTQKAASEQPPVVFEKKPLVQEPLMASQSRALREKDENDLEFLRNKTSGATADSSKWKYAALVAVLVIAGVAAYRWYSGMTILPFQSTTTGSKPGALRDGSTQPAQEPRIAGDAQTSTLPSAAKTAPKQTSPTLRAKTNNTPPPQGTFARGVTPATQMSREIPTTSPRTGTAGSPTTGPTGGAAELAQAERYLSATSGKRDTSEAAKWLWKSVSKENGRAVLLLSDLYAKGDGVPKSCDQARLLLSVAAKKGNADAATRLRTFDSSGCQ
jgi:hypothetical protein